MSGTSSLGRANDIWPSTVDLTRSIRSHTVVVAAVLAVLAALAGCGLIVLGASAHSGRLPQAVPTYAPGLRPYPAGTPQTAPADVAGILVPLAPNMRWIPKYPELGFPDASTGRLQEYDHVSAQRVMGGRRFTAD